MAPEALSRFYLPGSAGPHTADDRVGASWMTREDRDAEIEDQVTYLDMVAAAVLGSRDRGRTRIVALGFSQGAAAVCRWAARTATRPDELVLWGSGVPADVLDGDDSVRLRAMRITLVVGANDAFIGDGAIAEQRERLGAAGLSHRVVRFEGGHELDPRVLREIAASV